MATEAVATPTVEELFGPLLSPEPKHHSATALQNECILVVEFCELDGPRPYMLLPESTKSQSPHFDADSLAVRLITTDRGGSRDKSFRLAPDFQMIVSCEDQGVYCYAHYFTLYDLQARGYVRPYCTAYVSPDPMRPVRLFHRLRATFGESVGLLKACNHRQFIKQLNEAIDGLHSRECQAISAVYGFYYSDEPGSAHEDPDFETTAAADLSHADVTADSLDNGDEDYLLPKLRSGTGNRTSTVASASQERLNEVLKSRILHLQQDLVAAHAVVAAAMSHHAILCTQLHEIDMQPWLEHVVSGKSASSAAVSMNCARKDMRILATCTYRAFVDTLRSVLSHEIPDEFPNQADLAQHNWVHSSFSSRSGNASFNRPSFSKRAISGHLCVVDMDSPSEAAGISSFAQVVRCSSLVSETDEENNNVHGGGGDISVNGNAGMGSVTSLPPSSDLKSAKLIVPLMPVLPHILNSLLMGQFILIFGSEMRRSTVTSLLQTFYGLIPTAKLLFPSSRSRSRNQHPSNSGDHRHQNGFVRSGSLPKLLLNEGAFETSLLGHSAQLVGQLVPAKSRIDDLVPATLLRSIARLDLNSDVFHGVPYDEHRWTGGIASGGLLSRLSTKAPTLFRSDAELRAYLASLVFEYNLMAFILYHFVYRDQETYRCNASRADWFCRKHLGASPSDLRIARRFLEIIMTMEQSTEDNARLGFKTANGNGSSNGNGLGNSCLIETTELVKRFKL